MESVSYTHLFTVRVPLYMPFGSILRRTGRFLTGMESGRYYDGMYGNRQHYRNSAFGQHCSESIERLRNTEKGRKKMCIRDSVEVACSNHVTPIFRKKP